VIGAATNLNKRELLLANWFVCARPPEGGGRLVPPDAQAWTALPRLLPAAAAMRELGQWSIDGPPRRFDAEDWWYRINFDAGHYRKAARTVLGFDGLATIAHVWLNGKELLSSSNMFASHQVDVGSLLKDGGNDLLIYFPALDSALSLPRKRPRWRTPMAAHQQLRWFRTTLLGRTPGWSPPAAVVGPWKDVWLQHCSLPEVNGLRIDAQVKGSAGMVKCELKLEAAAGQEIETVLLELERGGKSHTQILQGHEASGFSCVMVIQDVDLWWPHTHGEPALYNASLKIIVHGVEHELVAKLGKIGFRTIVLDAADGDFSLHVNGVRIFCRGACWTPLDAVTLRSSPGQCGSAVVQARAAGMNMLRVAGTMVYEEDHFYEACDEQGVLVWQDFMFANMDYPGEDAEFSATVRLEARQQLLRLQTSACLAVLCGNSECEQQASMWGTPREQWQPALFNDTLAQLCADLVPGVPYWPSSAHGGSFPHQANAGTTSYYGVGAYLRPLDDARRAGLRFATECLAFANVPAPSAIERMPGGLAGRVHHPGWKERSPRDLGAGWDFDDVRDHYLGLVFNIDPVKLRYSDHERYLTLSRMATGEVMAASFAEWRRPGSSCHGAMILMLRDLWAGAGWGLVDDAGVPKACYHYLKQVLQPVSVLLSDEGVSGLFLHIVNERAEEKRVEIEVAAWRDGDVRVAFGEKSLTVPARGSRSMACLDLLGHFVDLNNAYRFGPMSCDVVAVTLRDAAGVQLGRSFYFPAGLNSRADADIGLCAHARMLDERTAILTVETKRFAQGVHFDTPGFSADDEYFHLPPASTTHVILRSSGTYSPAAYVHAANSVKSARVEWVAAENAVQYGAHAR
jgi:beta-mannosidase